MDKTDLFRVKVTVLWYKIAVSEGYRFVDIIMVVRLPFMAESCGQKVTVLR